MKSDLDKFYFDAILTSDDWDHLRYLIKREIEDCDCEGIGEFYSRMGVPFLRNFEQWIETKLIEAGFKKELIKEEIWIKGLIYSVECKHGQPYQDYRWDLHPPFGFPAGTYKISDDKHTLWFNPEVEAAFRTLGSIRIMRKLLRTDGAVNKEAVKVYLHTLALTINLTRAGNISEKAIQGQSHSNTQSKKGQRPRNVNGMTPGERKTRNEKIKAAFKKWKDTKNNFCITYGKKYDLSASAIKEIIKTIDKRGAKHGAD